LWLLLVLGWVSFGIGSGETGGIRPGFCFLDWVMEVRRIGVREASYLDTVKLTVHTTCTFEL